MVLFYIIFTTLIALINANCTETVYLPKQVETLKVSPFSFMYDGVNYTTPILYAVNSYVTKSGRILPPYFPITNKNVSFWFTLNATHKLVEQVHITDRKSAEPYYLSENAYIVNADNDYDINKPVDDIKDLYNDFASNTESVYSTDIQISLDIHPVSDNYIPTKYLPKEISNLWIIDGGYIIKSNYIKIGHVYLSVSKISNFTMTARVIEFTHTDCYYYRVMCNVVMKLKSSREDAAAYIFVSFDDVSDGNNNIAKITEEINHINDCDSEKYNRERNY